MNSFTGRASMHGRALSGWITTKIFEKNRSSFGFASMITSFFKNSSMALSVRAFSIAVIPLSYVYLGALCRGLGSLSHPILVLPCAVAIAHCDRIPASFHICSGICARRAPTVLGRLFIFGAIEWCMIGVRAVFKWTWMSCRRFHCCWFGSCWGGLRSALWRWGFFGSRGGCCRCRCRRPR